MDKRDFAGLSILDGLVRDAVTVEQSKTANAKDLFVKKRAGAEATVERSMQ